jgi:hypothetical protein
MVATPRRFAEIARVGPIAHQGRTIDAFLRDPALTGVVAVALPGEMPVNETFMLRDGLKDAIGLELDRVVVNGCYPERFGACDVEAVRALAARDGASRLTRSALAAALSEHTRARLQAEQVARLEDGIGQKAVRLPFVFAPALDREALEGLSRVLEEGL